jgi:Zn-dependent M16 (insulinase) family peptidase
LQDLQTTIALETLGEYLSDSAVSVLSQTFIEIDEPVATSISFSTSYQLPCKLTIYFESVPVEHLETLEEDLFNTLRDVANKGIDMERMTTVVEKQKHRYLFYVEEQPSDIFSQKLINEALYGTLDGKTLKEDVTDIKYYDALSSWTSDEWITLLQRWYIDNPHVCICGKPSAQLAKEIEQNELARIEKQREKLGNKGLAEKKRKLEEAQELNDTPIPQDQIRKFKIPKISHIKFIDTLNAEYVPRSTNPRRSPGNEVERYLDSDSSDHPLNVVYSHTSTQFVTVALYITTKGIPGDLLPYLQPYLDSFFALPVIRNGEIVEYEKIVAEVNNIAVDHTASLGIQSVNEVVMIQLRAEKSQYKKVVRLLGELFVHSVFDPERYGC